MSKVRMPREEVTYNVPPLEAVKGSIATTLTGLSYAMTAAVATKDARLVAISKQALDDAWLAVLPILERCAELETPAPSDEPRAAPFEPLADLLEKEK